MRDSVVFFKSYYDGIKNLPNEVQLELYNAIFEYSFNSKEPKLEGISKGIFTIIKPTIDSANARYRASVENGKKGGRPSKNKNLEKPNNNLNETQQKPNDNLNVNVYVDDNVNVNDNIYTYYENIFGRTLNQIEYQTMTSWLANGKKEDEVKKAIDETAKSNIDNIKYVEKVLYSNKKKNNKGWDDDFWNE